MGRKGKELCSLEIVWRCGMLGHGNGSAVYWHCQALWLSAGNKIHINKTWAESVGVGALAKIGVGLEIGVCIRMYTWLVAWSPEMRELELEPPTINTASPYTRRNRRRSDKVEPWLRALSVYNSQLRLQSILWFKLFFSLNFDYSAL